MVNNIQLIRAIAAYLVVFHHIIFFSRNFYSIHEMNFGAVGVDIFFVISGFIMIYATSGRKLSLLEFYKNRIIRIIPIYWMTTLFIITLIYIGFSPFGISHVSPKDILTSLLLIPNPEGQAIKPPILFVGWTLIYELFFYFFFGFLLLFRSKLKSVLFLGILFLSLCVASSIFTLERTAFGYYARPILLEFIMGCLLGLFYTNTPKTIWRKLKGKSIHAIALAVSSIILLDYYFAGMVFESPEIRLLVFGVPSAIIVMSALALERSGVRIKDTFILLQGSASYSIYLIHPFILQPLFKVAGKLMPNAGASEMVLVALFSFAAVCIAGTMMHLFIERPITNLLKSYFSRRDAQAQIQPC